MRRLSFVLAALLAAGCQVDTEGAACETDAHCPDGQACGLDRTCSARAAACDERCTPGEKKCTEDGPTATITICDTTRDAVCGSWEPLDACAAGLVCAADAPACACRTVKDGSYYFDPDPDPATVAVAEVAPTGAASPSGCRLEGIEEALAKAADFGEGGRAVFAGDAFVHAIASSPFTIPAGVTLTTTAPNDPSRAVLTIASLGSASSPAVVLQPGAALEGFTLRNEGATTGVGVGVVGDGTMVPEMRHVRVLARKSETEAFATGIAIGEGCGAEFEEVAVNGASGPALFVDSGADAQTTLVRGGAFESSQHGIEIRSGRLTVEPGEQPTRLAGNRHHGLFATHRDAEPYPAILLSVTGAEVTENDETALRLADVPLSSNLTMAALEIHANRATTEVSEHANGRKAGGVVLQGEPPASFSFRASRVYGNGGDQVGVYSSSPWWLAGLDPGAEPTSPCEVALPNVFACPSTDSDSSLMYAWPTTVNATWNVWDVEPPSTTDVTRATFLPTYRSRCSTKPTRLPACARIP
jgi:hypothetical protein